MEGWARYEAGSPVDHDGDGFSEMETFPMKSIYERRELSGYYHIAKSSPWREASHADSDGDGRWDFVEITKKYLGFFRFPESEFDRHFGHRWKNGVQIRLEDNDRDGCFEKKRSAERNDSGEIIVSDLIGNCDVTSRIVSSGEALKECNLRAPTEEERRAAREERRRGLPGAPPSTPAE